MSRMSRVHPPRAVADDAGATWLVFEERALPHERWRLARTPDWQASGWLVFRSLGGEERRLPLPPRWRAITDTALRALLTAAASAATTE